MSSLEGLPARMAAKIAIDANGCWIWIGALSDTGYGSFRWDGKPRSTHRLAYTLLVGEIPVGLDLDHLCRVRACCNPAHLEPVTRAVNAQRGLRAQRRERCPQGHAYDPTYLSASGAQICRPCSQEWKRAYRERKRAAA